VRGSVKRRGDSWTYTVDLPRSVDGKRRQRRRGGFPTKKVAEESLREFLGHVARGGDPFGDRTTFGEYALGWAEHHQTQVEPQTWRRYEQLLRLHILPELAAMRLQAIRAAHIQAVLNKIDRAPRTVQHVRALLSKIFLQAVAWGLIPASPVPATSAPKAERPDLDVPDKEGAKALMAAANGTPWEMPVFLAAWTGARRGEVLAIGWDQVDLDRARIRIHRSLERLGGEFRLKEPKTKRSRREVAIPPFVVDRLRRWKVEQAARQLAAGPAWQNYGIVCDRGDGGYIDPDSFSKAFKRLAGQVGHPDTRLHDLRHAAATTMMEQGVHPSVVSRTLGHSSEAFTMQVYGHVRDEMLDQAAEALGDAYGTS
jgi:integrase